MWTSVAWLCEAAGPHGTNHPVAACFCWTAHIKPSARPSITINSSARHHLPHSGRFYPLFMGSDTRAFSFGVTHFNVFWHLNHTWQQTVMTRSSPFATHCGRDVGGRQQNCPGLTTSHQSFLLSHSNPKVPNVLCASEKHRTELEWDLCWSTSCWMSALFLQTHVSSPADLNHHNEILVKSAWPFSGTRASGQPAYLGQDLEGGHSSRTMVSVLNPVIK